MDLDKAVREALGLSQGHVLDWRTTRGCQLVSSEYRQLLACSYREAKWQCEVIGPHTDHRWSDHLKAHERAGNGYSCASIGDGKEILAGPRPTPFHVIGVFR